jgi:hypothetical protein
MNSKAPLNMAKLRSVNTHFWEDDFVTELPPDEKLLFLYLLTCPQSNIAGVFEVTDRRIVFDTGLGLAVIAAGLGALVKAKKIIRLGSWVILVNHHKNQQLNANMEKSRQALIKALPVDVQKAFETITEPLPNRSESLPKDNANGIKDELNGMKDEGGKPSLADRCNKFSAEVLSEEHIAKYGKELLVRFLNYWAEPNRSGSKMRMELQPTWKLSGRLATWASREVTGKKQGSASGRIYRE